MATTKTKPVAASKSKLHPAIKSVSVKTSTTELKAPPKAEAKAKPAAKTAMKEVVKNLHIITDIARPQSGPRLFAHTIAAMTVLGMFDKSRPAVMRSALQAMIGATAVRYHAKTKGNLLEEGDRVRLTEPGVGFFRARKFDVAEEQGFEKLFLKGDGADVKVRAQHIVPVSLAV